MLLLPNDAQSSLHHMQVMQCRPVSAKANVRISFTQLTLNKLSVVISENEAKRCFISRFMYSFPSSIQMCWFSMDAFFYGGPHLHNKAFHLPRRWQCRQPGIWVETGPLAKSQPGSADESDTALLCCTLQGYRPLRRLRDDAGRKDAAGAGGERRPGLMFGSVKDRQKGDKKTSALGFVESLKNVNPGKLRERANNLCAARGCLCRSEEHRLKWLSNRKIITTFFFKFFKSRVYPFPDDLMSAVRVRFFFPGASAAACDRLKVRCCWKGREGKPLIVGLLYFQQRPLSVISSRA